MTFENSSALIIYISVFFLGLGLNLTPCVYPMLSITISLFRSAEGEPRSRAFFKALAYVLGMVTMYSVLGLAASVTGSFFGQWLQNFWVQLAVGILVTGLASSMLGLYQFRLPAWLMPSGSAAAHGALLSFFISGLLVGIIAAPCMGPAVLTLLAYVSTQENMVFGFSLFFVMALGLGLPYLILGTFSGLLAKLPRSGGWLVWFERLMGVVLLTFGVSYITIAFQWPFLKGIVPGALVAGGIFLGWIENSARGSKKFVVAQRILGTLAVIAGCLFFFTPKSGLVWEKYRAGILEEARAAGQPVVLDFYADWCIPCHELDQYTYSDAAVIAALKNFRKIKVDATFADTDEVMEAVSRFNVDGVPTVVFLDEKGFAVEELRIDGFIPAEELLGILEQSGLGNRPLSRVAEE